MRNYDPDLYIDLIENSNSQLLINFMEDEKKIISGIKNRSRKNVIDLGAGYGRALSFLKNNYSYYYGIEINESMYNYLNKETQKYKNTQAIHADFSDLNDIITKNKINPNNTVFLLIQNTIGTIEGHHLNILDELKNILCNNSSELIISFFKSTKLSSLGLEMFSGIEAMVGRFDYKSSDLKNGIFKTNTGYEAKWWSNHEINNIIQSFGLNNCKKIYREAYCIFHLNNNKHEVIY